MVAAAIMAPTGQQALPAAPGSGRRASAYDSQVVSAGWETPQVCRTPILPEGCDSDRGPPARSMGPGPRSGGSPTKAIAPVARCPYRDRRGQRTWPNGPAVRELLSRGGPVTRPRVSSIDDLQEYVESRPSQLGCWRDGFEAQFPTLAWLNVEPVVKLRKLAQEIGIHTAAGLQNAAHHNQVGIGAGWITKYMTAPRRGAGATSQDRSALLTLAGRYWGMRNLLVEVRVGVRGFEASGSLVRLPYLGNRDMDSLDRMFDLVEMLDSMRVQPIGLDDGFKAWMKSSAATTSWQSAPAWVRAELRRAAKKTIENYERYLDETVDLGGCSVADHDAYWRELMARGMYSHSAIMRGTTNPLVAAPIYERNAFIASMAEGAGIGQGAAEWVTGILDLDLDRCPDGALTPLVRLGDAILPMSSLIVPGSPHRNLLAIMQSTPSTVGRVGQLLGIAGERATLEVLRRMDHQTKFATRVKVVRPNGDSAGDLDVVAMDPHSGQVAVFEIKWHIAADGNAEVYRAESLAHVKRAQVLRLRGEIERAEAVPRWPQGWPTPDLARVRWFVLTRDVLAQRNVDADDVTIRSVQLIKRMLRQGAKVADLVSLLDDPPLPPRELRQTQWERIRYGDLRIEAEMILA
jgi:hypothetical protein